jgi:type VI secretion system Hcp family effector
MFSVTVASTKQGNFTGSSSHQAWVETSSLTWGVTRNAGLAQGTGEPQYRPVIITREVDAASPKFLQAWVTKEVLKSVKINWSRGGNGKLSPRYTTELSNALITNIKRVSLPGVKGLCERVEFTCEKSETKIDFSRR